MKKTKRVMIAVILAALTTLAVLTSCSAKNGLAASSDNYYSDASEDNESIAVNPGEKSTAPANQKLIKRYNVSAEAKEYDEALKMIDKAVTDAGGYFEKRAETNAYGKRDVRVLSAIIRIPEDKSEGFLTGVRGALNVRSYTKTADNVTEAYIDTEARLQTLEAEREGLLNMISSVDSAKDYDFWLTLHHELSDKEQDIAALRARLKSYDNLVSYSTFELDLTEVKEYTEPEKEAYGSRLGTAFKESWENFAENFKDFTVVLVRALPALLTFAVISTVIFLCIFLPVRAGIKKRRK